MLMTVDVHFCIMFFFSWWIRSISTWAFLTKSSVSACTKNHMILPSNHKPTKFYLLLLHPMGLVMVSGNSLLNLFSIPRDLVHVQILSLLFLLSKKTPINIWRRWTKSMLKADLFFTCNRRKSSSALSAEVWVALTSPAVATRLFWCKNFKSKISKSRTHQKIYLAVRKIWLAKTALCSTFSWSFLALAFKNVAVSFSISCCPSWLSASNRRRLSQTSSNSRSRLCTTFCSTLNSRWASWSLLVCSSLWRKVSEFS